MAYDEKAAERMRELLSGSAGRGRKEDDNAAMLKVFEASGLEMTASPRVQARTLRLGSRSAHLCRLAQRPTDSFH